MASAYIMDTIRARIHLLTAHEMLINGGEWAVYPLYPAPSSTNDTEEVSYTIVDLYSLPDWSPKFNMFLTTLGDNGNNTFLFDLKHNALPFTPLLVHELHDPPILSEGYGRNTFGAIEPSCACVYNSKIHSAMVFDVTVSSRYHQVDFGCMQMDRLKDLDLQDINYVLVTPYENDEDEDDNDESGDDESGDDKRGVEVLFPRTTVPGVQVKVWNLPMRKQSWLHRIGSECCIFIVFMLLTLTYSVNADYEVMRTFAATTG